MQKCDYMELIQIKHFINIVECGSMIAASEKHHISQSTLSYTVKQLENELGVRLFERSGRNLRLTGAGELFYTGVVKLEEEHLALIRSVSSYGKEISPLKIITDVVDYGTECCRIYNKIHPEAMVEYQRVPAVSAVIKDLARGKTDLVISTTDFGRKDPRSRSDLTSELLLDEPLLVFASRQHPISLKSAVTLEDLSDLTFIAQPEHFEYRMMQDKILKEAGVETADILEYSETETCALYAESGKGVMFIPESVRGYQLQGNNPFNNEKAVSIPVTDSICRRRIWMSMRSDREGDASIRAFAAFCRRYSAFIYDNKRLPVDGEI